MTGADSINQARTLTTTLRAYKRLPSSANGNPRWLIAHDYGVDKTAPDSMCNYSVSDHHWGERVVLTFNRRGMIVSIDHAAVPID